MKIKVNEQLVKLIGEDKIDYLLDQGLLYINEERLENLLKADWKLKIGSYVEINIHEEIINSLIELSKSLRKSIDEVVNIILFTAYIHCDEL